MQDDFKRFQNVFGSEKCFEFVDIKSFEDYLLKLRLGLLPLNSSTYDSFLPVIQPLSAITAMKLKTKNI